jgi:hypothetical protein
LLETWTPADLVGNLDSNTDQVQNPGPLLI